MDPPAPLLPHILEDVLSPGLRVVFVGTAAGAASAARGAYYAGPGNKFWPTLAAIGLTPRLLRPEEFRSLPGLGIGLTDMAKHTSGSDASLAAAAFDVPGFVRRIRAVRPGVVAFNGVRAARVFFGRPGGPLGYGAAPPLAGFPLVWVLPSTSGAAAGRWDIGPWRALAAALPPLP